MNKLTPTQQRQVAFEMYMSREKTSDISKATGLSVSQVRALIRKENWKQQRDELEAEIHENFIEKYRKQIQEVRLQVMKRHLVTSKRLDIQVNRILKKFTGDKTISPDGLLSLARAAKSSADISARAVGMSDRIDPIAETPKKAPTLISLNVNVKPVDQLKARGVEEAKFKLLNEDDVSEISSKGSQNALREPSDVQTVIDPSKDPFG